MSDSHLINTLKMLRRYASHVYSNVFRNISAMASFVTADMATLHADQNFDLVCEQDWTNYVAPIYWNMVSDAERRGLKYETE